MDFWHCCNPLIPQSVTGYPTQISGIVRRMFDSMDRTESKPLDTEFWMPDAGFVTRNTGFGRQETEVRTSDAGLRIRETEYRTSLSGVGGPHRLAVQTPPSIVRFVLCYRS